MSSQTREIQDRRAITSQLLTIENANFNAENLCSETQHISNVAVGNFRLINQPLKQDQLKVEKSFI